MTIKLFTIGDSISQGFMSGAAARTDLCYSSLIARTLGLSPGSRRSNTANYFYPEWEANGIKTNLEAILRKLNQKYGSDIGGLEWLTVLATIDSVLNESEAYYERGLGKEDRPYYDDINFFHNVAIQGFNIGDSWLVKPSLCWNEIKNPTFKEDRNETSRDDFLKGANAAFYRTALRVLDPQLTMLDDGKDFSQIDWLRYHANHNDGEGIENLLLWHGSNNALGTVLGLEIKQTPNDPNRRPHTLSHLERKQAGWNLWHPKDFEAEYQELLDRIDPIMTGNTKVPDWKVFVGNIPLVTIIPFAKGVGDTTEIPGKGTYYKYYTYFPFEEEFAVSTGKHLTMQDAVHIDDCIREYNRTIQKLIDQKNAAYVTKRYHVIDISQSLSELAFKRNNGNPTYQFPEYFKFIYPPINTKYYHADANGRVKQGGFFSLDGVHPSTIGQGLIAHEFLKVMQQAGRAVAPSDLKWSEIFDSDNLYKRPISLMQEIYNKDKLAEWIIKAIQLFKN